MLVCLGLVIGCAGGSDPMTATSSGNTSTTSSTATTGDPEVHSVFSAQGSDPGGMALSPDGATLIFASQSKNRVLQVDTTSQRVQQSATLLGGPVRAAVSPTRGVFVVLMDKGELVRLDTSLAAVERVHVGLQPRSVLLDEARRTIYVCLFGGHKVVALNLDTLERKWEAQVPRGPRFLVLHPPTGNVIVGSALTGELTALDPTGVLLEQRYLGLALTSGNYNSSRGTLYTTDYAAGQLFELNPLTLETIGRGEAGFGATGIGFNQEDGQVYVGNAIGDIISRLPLNALSAGTQMTSNASVQGFIFPPGTPTGFAADYGGGEVYSFDSLSGSFTGPLK